MDPKVVKYFRVLKAYTGKKYHTTHVRVVAALLAHIKTTPFETRAVAFVKSLHLTRRKGRRPFAIPILDALDHLYYHVSKISHGWVILALLQARPHVKTLPHLISIGILKSRLQTLQEDMAKLSRTTSRLSPKIKMSSTPATRR